VNKLKYVAFALFMTCFFGWPSFTRALEDPRFSVETLVPLRSVQVLPNGRRLEDTVTVDLFRPRREGQRPTAVIISSSGGVTAHTELFYARVLAAEGMVALVVDSFLPRAVRDTVADQSRLSQSRHFADAGAAFHFLASQPYVDPKRIIILGMSRGANAALFTLVNADRIRLGLDDIRFAAHVAITPACAIQPRNSASSGAPVFFALAERDDLTRPEPCLEFAQRIRASGNQNVRFAVYPGVFHAQEGTGGAQLITAETSRDCSLWREDNGRLTDRHTGSRFPAGRERIELFRRCVGLTSVTVGGDPRMKAQLTADILQFLRDVDVIADAEAGMVVPECARLPDGQPRLSCTRAQAGWLGDIVALGRLYRHGRAGLDVDLPRAVRLFELAASRGHPQGQWELGFAKLSNERGTVRDFAEARRLFEQSAQAGEAAAMNSLGVLHRDGLGVPRDDTIAARWFHQAAILRHPAGLANYGRFLWQGRGALAQDDVRAVALWRIGAAYEYPWAELYLAEALSEGRGTIANRAEAARLYAKVAGQSTEPQAAQRARDALARNARP
jgi:dienelactone hydrolase